MSEGFLSGTIKTPLGTVSKTNAAIAGGLVAVLVGVVWYRQKKNASPYDPTAAGTAEINPATGYPFGSVEDAAAMARQAQYVSPGGSVGGSGGGGGGSIGSGATPRFTNNGEWSQYVILYMSENDLIDDPSMLSAALGKYLAGQPVTTEQTSLIEQAIAIADKPPLAGSTGYPPSINTSPTAAPQYMNVTEGTWVTNFLASHVELNLTLDKLKALNPGVIMLASAKGYDPQGTNWVINSAATGGRIRIS